MPLYHNSRSPACRNPVGSVRTGQAVVLRLLGAKELVRADVRLWDGQTARTLPMNRVDESVVEAVIPMPQQPGLVWYDFRAVDRDGRARAYGNAPDGLGGTGQEQDCPHAHGELHHAGEQRYRRVSQRLQARAEEVQQIEHGQKAAHD